MYHIFQFSFRKLIECMFIHSAKMIPYKMLFIIDVFMIINHYITYNRLNNLTVYNKRKTCSDIITHLLKQKNFTFHSFSISFPINIYKLADIHIVYTEILGCFLVTVRKLPFKTACITNH